MDKAQLLRKIDRAWSEFRGSYAGLPDAALTEAGAVDDWSVKDIIGHVTTWEAEAVKYLPLIGAGETPPRYSVTYGGIDAFNALMTEEKRALPVAELLGQQEEVHARLLAIIEAAPDALLARETRFRRRIRLDTYGHYPHHTAAIRTWRDGRAEG
jgi:hypothetical protein